MQIWHGSKEKGQALTEANIAAIKQEAKWPMSRRDALWSKSSPSLDAPTAWTKEEREWGSTNGHGEKICAHAQGEDYVTAEWTNRLPGYPKHHPAYGGYLTSRAEEPPNGGVGRKHSKIAPPSVTQASQPRRAQITLDNHAPSLDQHPHITPSLRSSPLLIAHNLLIEPAIWSSSRSSKVDEDNNPASQQPQLKMAEPCKSATLSASLQ